MIISVASGKGGTGKTTIATNLAFSIGSGVYLLDCDVEEPNAHLFLNPVMDQKKTALTPVPVIDPEKCSHCRKCADICRFNAIAFLKDTVLLFEDLCHSCGGCMQICPVDAISEKGRELGTMEFGRAGDVQFVHGRLRVGEAMSPPLIRQVRSAVISDAVSIIDAPPGTSCPVITAMKGVDFVLMVTEPTPFGLHDLKPAVAAVKVLGLPCGLVINRSDMGNNDVKKYAIQEGLPVLLEIPFDRKIAEAYSNGRLIAREIPAWKDQFRKLYQDIQRSTG